jgi:uncharacterized membrane protein YeaQ/YmgE (transglycosylase-associated protein family)
MGVRLTAVFPERTLARRFQLVGRRGQKTIAGGTAEWRSSMYFLYIIVVGLIAGWAAGKIMKGSGYGVLMDIVLGIVGAILGGWIIRLLGFEATGGLITSILVATLGAVVLVAISRMLKRA